MKIIQLQQHTESRIVGRMSDGSDRQVLEVTTWCVEAEQGERVFALTFDHEPTEQQIVDALAQGQGQEIVTVEIVSNRLAITKAELLTTQEAAAYLYEQHLTALDALAALYEQVVIGGDPR